MTGWLFPFCYDDAFISFRITENLVDFGVPFFNRNHPVYTSTSILYPIWNAIWKLSIGKDWIEHIGWLNGMLQAATLARIFYLLHKKTESYQALFIAILCIGPLALGVNQLAVGNSGLETAFYQLALAFTLLPSSFRERTSLFFSWILGFIRPEGFLVGITLAAELATSRRWKLAGYQLLIGALAVGLWAFVGLWVFGSVLPQSIMAKSNHHIDRLSELKSGYGYALFQGYGLFSLLIGSALFQFPQLRREFAVLLLWILFYTFFFSVLAAWWPWYVPPLLVPIMYMAGRSAICWTEELPRIFSNRNLLLASVCLLSFSVFTFYNTEQVLQKQSVAFQIRKESSKKLGHWLESNLKLGENVLLEPLGLIGYYSPQIEILDYPGLSSPPMSVFLHSLPWKIPHRLTDAATDSAILVQFRPNYLLLFPEEESAFASIDFCNKHYQKMDSLPYYPPDKRFDQALIYKIK